MKKATHTPGPWTVTALRKYFDLDQFEIRKPLTTITDTIATVYESNANARLIAAAPDMLEALRELRMYADLKLKQHRQDYSEEHCMVQTAIRMIATADAAIAKAQGK